MSDPVSSPSHYAGNGIECKEAMRSMMCGANLRAEQAYWWGCAFKYLWRWPFKNGKQDVEKCAQCLEYLLGTLHDYKEGR